jgi:hypothetical protein
VRVARLAADQHGHISIGQLRACGLSDNAVASRVRNGRLHRRYRGVYCVGHEAVTLTGTFIGAVLACGDNAVLSHRAAAAYHEMLRWDGRDPEVTVVGSVARHVDGIRVRRSRTLDRRDVWRRDSILVTSPARTVLDVATDMPARELRRMVRQAQAEGRVTVRQLSEVLDRGGRHRGAATLRLLIADGPTPTRSEFEDLMLDLLGRAGIPRPLVNEPLRLGGRTITPDLLFPHLRLVIELDGRAWHDHALAREEDADRQAILEAHGYRVLRITWHQLVRHPKQTLARINAALRTTTPAPAAPGSPVRRGARR